MSDTITIRDATPADEADWRRLWAGYNAFYETVVPAEVTSRTWQRILDPGSAIVSRIAEHDGRVAGFTNHVVHEGTWVIGPICYLEDLFVDPSLRRKGIGRRLIDDLVTRGKERGWSRLYWVTRHNNPARNLYDQFIKADDFVRYQLTL